MVHEEEELNGTNVRIEMRKVVIVVDHTFSPVNFGYWKSGNGAIQVKLSRRNDTFIPHGMYERRSINLYQGGMFFGRNLINSFTGKEAAIFDSDWRHVQMTNYRTFFINVIRNPVTTANTTIRSTNTSTATNAPDPMMNGGKRIMVQKNIVSIPPNLWKWTSSWWTFEV